MQQSVVPDDCANGYQSTCHKRAHKKAIGLPVVIFFTASRNARIASTVLATAIPSVCPSVTRRYCVNATARSTVQFAPSDIKMYLVL